MHPSFITLAMLFPALAEAATAFDVTTIAAKMAEYGPIGIVLAWFMFRNEQRLRAIEGAINLNSRTLLNLSYSLPNVPERVKESTAELKREAETRITQNPQP